MAATFILGIIGGIGLPELIMVLILCLGSIISRVFYLYTLQKTLEKINPQNREMSPNNVWFELIPVFNLVWQFFNVIYVSNALKKEFNANNVKLNEERPAYSIGIACCILTCISVIPIIGLLTIIAAFICWVVFWVKISSYKSQLEALQ